MKKWMYKLCALVLSLSFVPQNGFLDAENTTVLEEREECKEESFEWGVPKELFSLSEDLKERWAFSMLQECMRSKLEKLCSSFNVPCKIHVEKGLLPCQFSGTFVAKEPATCEIMALLRASDFKCVEEFDVLQGIWIEWIEMQKNLAQDIATRRSFLLEQEGQAYDLFLEDSLLIVQNMTLEDLENSLKKWKQNELANARRFKSYSLGQPLAAREYQPGKKGWEPSNSGGRGGEPKSVEAQLFFDLPLTDEDKVNIRKIITTMSDKNVLQLLLEKKSLERKGDKIRYVHPMRFIGFVLSDPNLCRCMKSISKATFKWSGFLEGYEKRMREEHRSDTLNRYVPGLADLLEADRGVIQNYINQEDYSGLVKYFI